MSQFGPPLPQPWPGSVPLVIDTAQPMDLNLAPWKARPSVVIDNHELNIPWGRVVIPVTPAVHDVQIRFGFTARYSQVQVDTRYAPQTVYFRRSWSGWTAGAIGLEPVKAPGLSVFLAQLAFSGLLFVGVATLILMILY